METDERKKGRDVSCLGSTDVSFELDIFHINISRIRQGNILNSYRLRVQTEETVDDDEVGQKNVSAKIKTDAVTHNARHWRARKKGNTENTGSKPRCPRLDN